ncbi:MAG: hypothetical protein UU08_C0002G0013 [Candidatus Uhrbacteria bacterium GW2011_GWE2_40_58]|nr:MAG: hypothetical protein UT94_C0048G0006 [Candidatus Uhrbacteria bacterium GW2011_GWF2_40_263]KKR68162.1 MAG: hypothetical protein UU08_C0002G0013 [Candidatus Uhrbacteria bacterium GW2011_GWE2_40_58]OGL91850.1 MAG: hypothetical protein A2239_01510 [Candidatus Uhrbacteria bacterium RIFOXYA2_FULL_40_9]OGL97681.1 MAG: hypothetical protein A2332_00850 [Candidatus Uhrbacteria bacterium RIFOXYB2_FULL_41_18]HBK34695.1 hypothetical protein [Candidatus Uhrbacteria bacterium]
MSLSLRTKRLLIFLAILIIAILLSLFIISTFPKQEKSTEIKQEETIIQQPVVQESEEEHIQREQQLVSESAVRSLSDTFTERYGSYSTESDFANLRDVLVLMTDRFAADTQNYLDSAKSSDDYYAVTTQVLNVKILDFDEEAKTATTSVSTQRQESRGTIQDMSVIYQTLFLELIWEQGMWKVDVAEWQ